MCWSHPKIAMLLTSNANLFKHIGILNLIIAIPITMHFLELAYYIIIILCHFLSMLFLGTLRTILARKQTIRCHFKNAMFLAHQFNLNLIVCIFNQIKPISVTMYCSNLFFKFFCCLFLSHCCYILFFLFLQIYQK